MSIPSRDLKLSKYCTLIKVDKNTYCISHSLAQNQIYGDKKLSEVYKILSSAEKPNQVKEKLAKIYSLKETDLLIKLLIKKGFTKKSVKEKIKDNIPLKSTSGLSGFRLLRILLTDVCNLNCAYCKVMSNIKSLTKQSTSKKNIEKAIKIFFEGSSAGKPKIVHISGGEPTLCWEKIEYIVDLINKYKRENEKYFICIGTNATRLNEKKVNYIVQNNIKTIVSLDGRKNTHNILRKNHAGMGTFNEVHKEIMMLKNAGADIGISMVIGKHNINSLSEEIGYIIKTYNPISLGINFMKPPTKEEVNFPYLITPKKYVNKIYDVYKEYRHTGVYFELLYRKLEPFVKQTFRYQDCGATAGTTINIDARGKIVPVNLF